MSDRKSTAGKPWKDKAPCYFLACLWLFALLFMLRTFNHKINVGDEGIAAMGGWRIAQGQVPHRDFFEIVPPFSFLPTALVFKILGPSVLSERLLTLLYAVLLMVGVDRLLARYDRSPWIRAMALSVLIPAGVFYWPMPSHHWVVDILQIFSLLCLWRALEERRGAAAWAVLAGVLSALGCFSLQDQGSYLVLALCLAFFPWIRPPGLRWRMFSAWASGGIVTALLFAAALLPRVSASDLWYQWVAFPVQRYKMIPGNGLGLFAGWQMVLGMWSRGDGWRHPVHFSSLFTLQATLFLLPFLAAGVLLLAYLRRWESPERTGLLLAGSAAFVGTCAHRWSLTNLTWSAALPLVVVGWGLGRGWNSARAPARWAARGLWGIILAASLIFAGVYYRNSSRDRTVPVLTSAGTLRSVVHGDARALQEIVDAVDAWVPREGSLFVNGYLPLVNFLTLRPNPSRFNFFYYPVYHTEAERREVVALLDSLTEAYVLAARPIEPGNPIEGYILDTFQPVWGNERAVLFVKSPGAREKNPDAGRRPPGSAGGDPGRGGPASG